MSNRIEQESDRKIIGMPILAQLWLDGSAFQLLDVFFFLTSLLGTFAHVVHYLGPGLPK